MREVPARLLENVPYNSGNNLKYFFIQQNHKMSFETVKVYNYLICKRICILYVFGYTHNKNSAIFGAHQFVILFIV